MPSKIYQLLDARIDKLTRSIEIRATGRVVSTSIILIAGADEMNLNRGWRFDWSQELAMQERMIFKLIITAKPRKTEGLISLENRGDHVFVHLLESAPWNVGRTKKHLGVAGNLIAFACKSSKELGYSGLIAFLSKSALIHHYTQTLGARRINNKNLMFIEEDASQLLINRYFYTDHEI